MGEHNISYTSLSLHERGQAKDNDFSMFMFAIFIIIQLVTNFADPTNKYTKSAEYNLCPVSRGIAGATEINWISNIIHWTDTR